MGKACDKCGTDCAPEELDIPCHLRGGDFQYTEGMEMPAGATAPDYDSMSREELIEALKAADAHHQWHHEKEAQATPEKEVAAALRQLENETSAKNFDAYEEGTREEFYFSVTPLKVILRAAMLFAANKLPLYKIGDDGSISLIRCEGCTALDDAPIQMPAPEAVLIADHVYVYNLPAALVKNINIALKEYAEKAEQRDYITGLEQAVCFLAGAYDGVMEAIYKHASTEEKELILKTPTIQGTKNVIAFKRCAELNLPTDKIGKAIERLKNSGEENGKGS